LAAGGLLPAAMKHELSWQKDTGAARTQEEELQALLQTAQCNVAPKGHGSCYHPFFCLLNGSCCHGLAYCLRTTTE